jgi:hypothetical protein
LNRIVRELRSIPGLVLGTLFALIVTLWIVNLLATRTPAPISTAAGWAFGRATGQAYQPAAPAVVTSPYSANVNTYM